MRGIRPGLSVESMMNNLAAGGSLEEASAPVLVAMSVALLAWAVSVAGGFWPTLSTPSQGQCTAYCMFCLCVCGGACPDCGLYA